MYHMSHVDVKLTRRRAREGTLIGDLHEERSRLSYLLCAKSMAVFVVFTAATITVLRPYPQLNSGHFLVQPQQNWHLTSNLQSPKLSPAVGFLCHAKILCSRVLELCRKVLYHDFYILQFNRHRTMVINIHIAK